MRDFFLRLLYWTPRILGILFAAFISIFALDVFGAGSSLWETLLALAMHLIPTALIVVILVLAWRWEWIGALGFLGLGIWYLVMTRGRMHWSAYLVIAGPLFLLAILYLLNWLWRSEVRRARAKATEND